MCGINGFIDQSLSFEKGMSVLKTMANITTHRGPDNTSYYHKNNCFLAHNRLSIIDLSNEGNQPMQYGNLTTVFNGEIYNYKEIKLELQKKNYIFKSNSDTEVILISFKEWGSDCVNRFVGMWSFVIYNNETFELFCSRDRFGIKPFYFIHEGNNFYFSSEVKALKKTRLFTNDINVSQIKKAIQLGWLSYQNETMFSKVNQLEPATNMILTGGRIFKSEYWKISNNIKSGLTQQDIITKFREQVIDSLKLHVRSDVQVGATLSGGIDSSSIVSGILNQNLLSNINTFTIFYDEPGDVDERPFANSVIDKYRSRIEPHFLKPNQEHVADQFDSITYHNDFPLLGSSPISQYFIMQEISRFGIKVILSGQGADDYLGGYMHSYYRLYAELIGEGKFGVLFHEAKLHSEFQNLNINSWLKIVYKSFASFFFNEGKLLEMEYKYGLANLFLHKNIQLNNKFNTTHKFDQVHEAMLKFSSLPGLLHYEDRNSMAFSIESRVPFLDHRLVETAFTLPVEYKINNGYTKWILRQAMKDMLPEKIYRRKDKIGFVTPGEIKWLRDDLKFLLETDFKDIPNLDVKKANLNCKAFMKGDNSNAKIIWRLANMQKWIEKN
jgi:asparagine synthase (glutamine-hydrolysing)